MSYKKPTLLLIVLSFCLSISIAQTKKIVVRKGHGETDAMVNIDEEIIMLPEGADSDSLLKKVFIHKPHEKKAARVVIKKSGLFKKNKIVIDFDPMTSTILKVVDDDKDVPASKFHKYQDYLKDATELADLEELHPKMEELEFKIQLAETADSAKIAGLDELILELEDLESDHALMKKEHYLSVKKIIEMDKLQEEIQKVLENAGVTPPQKVKEIEIREGKFYLNGDEIEGERGQKCIQVYATSSGMDVDRFSSKERIKLGKVSIHILFD